jgi:serine/threonine-protein kinase
MCAASVILPPLSVFHGRYQVVRPIKEGGMGAVYEVIQIETRRHRALKVLLPSMVADPDVRSRFRREATVAADVDSEHIVETIDAGIDPATGTPFIVMELLKGEELAGLVERRGGLEPADVLLLLRQAALALEKTHAAGIVHRDLKPENLFVTRRDDGSPRLKILDFGIAKVVAQGPMAAQTTRVVGTPVYMAPEQLMGDGSVSGAADIYALGHIAFTLLVGSPYWSEEASAGGTYAVIAAALLGSREPPTARAARRGRKLPKAFDAWFQRATAATPGDRFARAGDLVEALGLALGISASSGPASADALLSAFPSDSTARAPVLASSLGTTPAAPLFGATELGREGPSPATTTSPVAPGSIRLPPPPTRRRRSRRKLIGGIGLLLAAAAALAVAGARLLPWDSDEEPQGIRRAAARRAGDADTRRAPAEPTAPSTDSPGTRTPPPAAPCPDPETCSARCSGGDPASCAEYGTYLRDGKRVPTDLSRAMALFDRACVAGAPRGCSLLGELYYAGTDVPKDGDKAFALFRRACAGGDLFGCVDLGWAYQTGTGTPRDPAASVASFEKACDAHSSLGCIGLGMMLRGGHGVPADLARAGRVFRQACASGQHLGCKLAGELAH